MSDFLKRLEIIQNAIALGDEDIIALQIPKLPPEAAALIKLLADQQYAEASIWLTQYRQNNLMPAEYKDPKLSGLQAELVALENKLTALTAEKADYEREIAEFTAAYMQEVGSTLQKVLQQQKDAAEKAAQNQTAEEKQQNEDLKKARQNYEEFTRQQQEQPPSNNLSEEEKGELKKLYKQAANKCHPDKLPDDKKEIGTQMFKELESAYRQQDLKTVRQIWQKLQDGDWRAGSAIIVNPQILRRRIAEARQNINALTAELKSIQTDEVYRLLQSLKTQNITWEEHFAQIKKDLQNQLAKQNDE